MDFETIGDLIAYLAEAPGVHRVTRIGWAPEHYRTMDNKGNIVNQKGELAITALANPVYWLKAESRGPRRYVMNDMKLLSALSRGRHVHLVTKTGDALVYFIEGGILYVRDEAEGINRRADTAPTVSRKTTEEWPFYYR